MPALGTIPQNISLLNALDYIGETIIIADNSYAIRWMNSEACRLLSEVVPLFGLKDCQELIGMNMDAFHKQPEHQRQLMEKLDDVHRSRINIRNEFVTDIIVTPIKNAEKEIEGYIVMLMDVTTQAEEQKRSEKLIKQLSIPILHIWEKTIALPLIGEFDKYRSDQLLATVLMECSEKGIEHVLVDLSGITEFEDQVHYQIQMLTDSLKLIGTDCILVGISPKLAMSIVSLESNTKTFSTAYQGLKYIINQKEK
ncbi:RsbR, positive regulator of sigma-B [Planococcus sp. N028]|uniref:RsbR, positive regulator of sigma-B n=1 Tax=Planococcus shixiaomingii TaxID=3058393 RepID=A0ABT8N684_9BACL|nr:MULTISPECIES: STAS domain-containing protein [unclassified Planococcus (in: firmicutes)]MDN7243248.1 RsbR, positive regulator of sigma-B [Planococcus sp. N028]WKA55190.1 RsbR, positive regulator of sigma-B [Planococcus sp. N022]